MGQSGLLEAHQFVAMNARLFFQTLRCANPNLGAYAVGPRVYRRANQGRESGIHQHLPADHDEDTLFSRILRTRLAHQIKLASLHGSCWYSSVSIASRFKRAAWRSKISMSFRSRACLANWARYAKAACSSSADRFLFTRSRRPSNSLGKVIDV